MVTQFNSTLSWLDSSESEGRAVMELVSALNEPGRLDELGIGSIRDTIADALFPGTSTIQTRARYFLFIPWILQMVEARSSGSSERLARQLQLQLCDALSGTHGPGAGVIGREGSAQAVAERNLLGGSGTMGHPPGTGSNPLISGLPSRAIGFVAGDMGARGAVEDRRYESADGILGRWAVGFRSRFGLRTPVASSPTRGI